ncbi:MAG: hypothetical protein M5U34_03960 [Chloroflexi bacterium]|nr:hypothetical protein [Chloroflexota bacterium]
MGQNPILSRFPPITKPPTFSPLPIQPETQGLRLTLEVMAANLPVIAVDATGTSDIVGKWQRWPSLTENDAGRPG